jgi:hypothetical protein
VTDGGAAIVIDRALVAVAPTLSATRMVKLDVPAVAGVPLMTPVPAFKVSPEGSDPTVMDHEKGATPPAFVAAVEYAAPTVPPGNADVVTVSAEAMVIERGRVAV